jgi:pyruvate, water dikinase
VRLIDAADESRFGGKAVQLGAALRAGLPVPDGWALDHEAVERIVGERACAIELDGRYAVRSSAVGEDSATASFAGQHATILGVRTAEELVAAIVAVRDSGHAPSALAYRAKLGVTGAPRVGVVVQRMVDATCAGVMFTRCPLTRADVRVIEGAWGLGETVVQGIVDPDRFRVARGGAVLERAIADKAIAIRLAGTHTEEVPVPDAERRAPCLGDAELHALDALATRCDSAYPDGRPHDIEWAFEAGQLFLLQRRAITR